MTSPGICRFDGGDEQSWKVLVTVAHGGAPLPDIGGDLADIYLPVAAPTRADGSVVVAQLGQSLDGRIATSSGHSHYVNGPSALTHLHRLRALVDAVVIGVGTAVADDPQLTVRRVVGPDPARVVIDPAGRLPQAARCLAEGARRIVFGSVAADRPSMPGVEFVPLEPVGKMLAPPDILAALAERGFRRILIEGGGMTISQFLAAGCLDRLHVLVAPMIIGSGPAGIRLPEIGRLDEALRPSVKATAFGDGDILFDCDIGRKPWPAGV